MSTPNESGYYYHTNGHGIDEIVYISFSCGTMWVHKIRQDNPYPISEDKGTFGERISLPSEE